MRSDARTTPRPASLAPDRTHTALRVAALVVLVAVCVWPRTRPPTHAAAGPRVEVTGAKRAPSAPRHVKLASTADDESIATR